MLEKDIKKSISSLVEGTRAANLRTGFAGTACGGAVYTCGEVAAIRQNEPCHGFLATSFFSKGNTYSAVFSMARTAEEAVRRSEYLSKVAVNRYYKWLLKESIWKDLFEYKSVAKALRCGFIVSGKVPNTLAVQALIATRYASSAPDKVQVMYKLIRRGVDPSYAFLFSHMFASAEFPCFSPTDGHYARAIYAEKLSLSDVRKFARGELKDLSHVRNFQESVSYSSDELVFNLNQWPAGSNPTRGGNLRVVFRTMVSVIADELIRLGTGSWHSEFNWRKGGRSAALDMFLPLQRYIEENDTPPSVETIRSWVKPLKRS